MKLSIPRLTRTISVTGGECAVNCAHCGRHYLHFMESPDEVIRRGPRNYRSALVSGGMNERHWVPVEKHSDLFITLKQWGWRLNFHTGLVPEDVARTLVGAADVISFDFVTDDATIEEVYGVKIRGVEYIRTLHMLSGLFTVVPHITLGLCGGEICGEMKALDALVELAPARIVFLVLRPTKGTRYGSCAPPALSDVEELFSHGRGILPDTEFSLGCMRPGKDYGFELEKLALKYCFNTVVMPSRPFVRLLDEKGIPTIMQEECCAL